MKKVLVIAYFFPPTGGGGVQRVSKFVKYLPSFGWSPVVLTVRDPDFDIFDESLLEDIAGDVKVYRTYSFEPIGWYRLKRYGTKSRFESAGRELLRDRNESPGRLLRHPLRILFKGARYVLNNMVLVPDDYIGWIPFAVLKGMKVIKKEKIEVIYATGKPWSSFVIALFLKFLTGRPYVLDLRDPWMLTPYGNQGATGLRRRIEGFWERITFSNAEKIININRQINNAYIRHYPSIRSEKFTFITHGYDQDDFSGAKRTEAGARFTISYVGTLYSNTSPDNFLKAVGSLLSEDPFMKDNIILKFVGFVPSHVKRMIKDLDLEHVVESAGCLPHRESIRHMVDSDVLLLLLNKVTVNALAQVSTGKLFEYLASRQPILALIPGDTDAARLINELGAGKVVDPDNVSEIKEAVCSLYQDYKRGRLKGHSADIGRFSRKELARQLCAVLS